MQGLPDAEVVVYRLDENGLARVERVQVTGTAGNYSATFPGTPAEA